MGFLSYFIFIFAISVIMDKNREESSFSLLKTFGMIGVFVISSSLLLYFGIETKSLKPLDWSKTSVILNIIPIIFIFIISVSILVYSFIKKIRFSDTIIVTSFLSISSFSIGLIAYGNILKNENISWILTVIFGIIILYLSIKNFIGEKDNINQIIISILPIPVLIFGIYKFNSLWIFFVSAFFSTLYYLSIYIDKREKSNNLIGFQVFSVVVSVLLLFGLSFSTSATYISSLKTTEKSLIPLLFFGFIMFFNQISYIINLLKNKVIINYFIILFPLFLFIIELIKISSGISINPLFINWFINIIILILSLNFFIIGVKERSVLIINIFAIFLIITFLIRFFELDVNLLVKGLVFLVSGVIMLIVNLVLSSIFKKGANK
ncbi:MAG TPA: hypothetical protein PK771_12270 [Spirochaetota bacterium]|nr:hypothetical protein [Spirochaetota bacterium]